MDNKYILSSKCKKKMTKINLQRDTCRKNEKEIK